MNYVVGFIFDSKLDNVLLLTKNPRNLANKELADFMRGKLNGIGGKVEFQELFDDAMVRECREETGLDITDWNYYCRIDWGTNESVYFYYTITDDIFNFKQLEHEKLDIYLLENPYDYRCYRYHPRMPNVDWLIPMAISHYKNNNKLRYYTISEKM